MWLQGPKEKEGVGGEAGKEEGEVGLVKEKKNTENCGIFSDSRLCFGSSFKNPDTNLFGSTRARAKVFFQLAGFQGEV